MRRAQRKQLTHNHDVIPVVVMAEVEVTARRSVATGHQGCMAASFQGPRCPHHQEGQHEQQEQPQPLQQPPIAEVGAPLGRARQKQLENSTRVRVVGKGIGEGPRRGARSLASVHGFLPLHMCLSSCPSHGWLPPCPPKMLHLRRAMVMGGPGVGVGRVGCTGE